MKKKIKKTKALYLDRYISYCEIINVHNIICKEIGSALYEHELNEYESLSFEEFVDCCFRGLIYSCYTYDVKTKKIYQEEKPFNQYAKIVGLKKEALFTFDPKNDLANWLRKLAKKKKRGYNIHVEPVKEWFGEPPATLEEARMREYPNIFKPTYKTVDIEELKKKYVVDNEASTETNSTAREGEKTTKEKESC